MLRLLQLAAEYSHSNSKDARTYLLGAVGVRKDGRIVHARNEAVFDTIDFWNAREGKRSKYSIYRRFPESHAEARLTRKLGYGAIVYVSRVSRGTGGLAIARPCQHCQAILKAYRVRYAYYTISDNQWGRLDLITEEDTYYGA